MKNQYVPKIYRNSYLCYKYRMMNLMCEAVLKDRRTGDVIFRKRVIATYGNFTYLLPIIGNRLQ